MNKTNKKVRVVQFIHPGGEHLPLQRDIKAGKTVYSWNYGNHRRKFMKVRGNYVDTTNEICQNELYFWGEWEPWSRFTPIVPANHTGDNPWYLHEPFYDKTPGVYPPFIVQPQHKDDHRQNTDPFVFGDHFLYCLCKQDHYNLLHELAPGSLILFGSCINPKSSQAYFALDTVFVVKEAIDYVPNTFQSTIGNIIPENYDKIMGFDDWNDNRTKILYRGVNFHEQTNYEGMYSFVPCKIGKIGEQGFERVHLLNNDIDVITDNLSQGLKCTDTDFATNKIIWQKVCDIVQQQNCYRGFKLIYK